MTNTKTPLQLAHDAKRAAGAATQNAVIDVLKKSKQPLLTREVQALLAIRGMRFDVTYVRQLLVKLAEEKLISSRDETAKERKIRRGDDSRGAHFTAIYYWAPTGKVPARTVKTVVQTTVIPMHPKKNSKSKRARRPVKAVSMQTGASPETTLVLLNRIASLEAEIARLKNKS